MSKTQLKKLNIKKFRALQNVEIDFGTHITVICGKNGTSKSSILGIAAQIFSFEKDYIKGEALKFKSITGSNFKSLPNEHFRFSNKYDVPGSLEVAIELYDGYSNSNASAELELMKRDNIARPVVRKNSTAEKGKESRNFTHPVIFLSLRRLQPIASREYKVRDFAYLDAHKQKFINLNNELLNKTSSSATGTGGSINSAVAHANNYDQDSVSAGEDNAGQIILALMSFRKLKEEYADYKGGLLLIDEADAGLFPAAQTKLLEILDRECNELNLQVVMTSHSPTLIESVYESSKKYQRKFKTVYLSDTFGPIQTKHDISWSEIYSDLLTVTTTASDTVSLPKINVYFEDKEGGDFFNKLIARHPSKKFINQLKDITLGCSNYIQLVQKGIPEFSIKSLIVLDADAKNGKSLKSIVLLPGKLPPDQLIFEFLYNLPRDDAIWQNTISFTRSVFTRSASQIISKLSISGDSVDLEPLIAAYRDGDEKESKKKLREVFKAFYKTTDFQSFLNLKGKSNPWQRWIDDNQDSFNEFRTLFADRLARTMRDGHGVDSSKLHLIERK